MAMSYMRYYESCYKTCYIHCQKLLLAAQAGSCCCRGWFAGSTTNLQLRLQWCAARH